MDSTAKKFPPNGSPNLKQLQGDRSNSGCVKHSSKPIVNHPANADFGLAFRELGRRHIDTRAAHASLITMLVSSNMRERQLGLARLKKLHPKLRNAIDPVIEDSPEQLHTQVVTALHKRRRQNC